MAFFATFVIFYFVVWFSEVEKESSKHREGTFRRSGQITSEDHKSSDGTRRFDLWLVELKHGEVLRAQLTSEIKPSIFVIGPMADAKPKALVTVVEPEGNTTTVECSPSESGKYAILVMAQTERYGAYDLTANRPVRSDLSEDENEGVGKTVGLFLVCFWWVQYSGLLLFFHWRHPDRILLLRPFGERRVSKALRRLNRRYLAYRGFTFTLADKHLKHSLAAFFLAHVPTDFASLAGVFYRPLFRRLHRRVFVRRRRDLAILRLRLRARYRLTSFWTSWLGFGDRINKFRSRDELWQECISILLDNCQVVVVDMSYAGSGTLWEVEEISRRGYEYKTVYIVRDDDAEESGARTALERAQPQSEIKTREIAALHRYDCRSGRFLNPQSFEEAYAVAVSSEKQPVAAPLPVSIKAIAAIAGFGILGPFWVPIGFVLGLLALRDIRRAEGFLKGEMLAHFAILLFLFAALLFVTLSAFVGPPMSK